MTLALCPQVVSRAPQHFRSSETQAICEDCFSRQSVWQLHQGDQQGKKLKEKKTIQKKKKKGKEKKEKKEKKKRGGGGGEDRKETCCCCFTRYQTRYDAATQFTREKTDHDAASQVTRLIAILLSSSRSSST